MNLIAQISVVKKTLQSLHCKSLFRDHLSLTVKVVASEVFKCLD